MRVLPIDIDGYISELERRARHELPDDLAALARDHVAFVRRLGSNELAQLYYACWCPELSRVQRLRRDLAEYATLVVQAGHSNGRGS